MASAAITPTSLRVLNTRLVGYFNDSLGTTPTWWEELATKVQSDSSLNTYGFLGDIPDFREWVGDRHVHGLWARDYTIRNKEYEATVAVKASAIKDNDIASAELVTRGLGQRAKKLPDTLLAAVLKAGTTTVGFDGQFFFDTDHPKNLDNSGAGTYSNYEASGRALSETNFGIVWAAFAAFLKHDGTPMGVMPTTLVVPPQLYATAKAIVGVDFAASGATPLWKGAVKVLMIPELADDATAWYLLDTSKPIKPFIVQEREAPSIVAQVSLTDDSVFWRNEFAWGAQARYGVGYGAHFLAYKAKA